MPVLAAIAGVIGAGAALVGATRSAPKIPNNYSGLTAAQKDKKVAAEIKLQDIQAVLQNRELDIATSQAEALNANTRAGGWLKISGAVGVGVILFLILRKKKVIEI